MIYQNYWRKYVNDVSLQLEVVWAGLVFHLSVGALLPLQLQKHAESLSIESCCQKIRPLNSLTLHLGKIKKFDKTGAICHINIGLRTRESEGKLCESSEAQLAGHPPSPSLSLSLSLSLISTNKIREIKTEKLRTKKQSFLIYSL